MSDSSSIDKLLRDAQGGNSAAQYNLGVSYLRGDGVAGDIDQARLWIERAAQAGLAPAQSALGYLCLRAQGGPYDPQEAVTLFRRAAEQGFAEAIYRYAEALAAGLGCQHDLAIARAQFARAAQGGHPLAECQLAYCLDEGIGGDCDPVGATVWLIRAAARGLPRAMAAIGLRFQTGHTLAPDPVRALEWFLRADAAGHIGAGFAARALGEQLDASEVAAAKARAREKPLAVVADTGRVVERAPVVVEPVCQSPRVSRLANLLSREECWHLMQLAAPFLRPSRVLNSESGQIARSAGRSSGGMSLAEPQRDVVVWNIEQRLAGVAALPLENGEPLALLRYEAGDEYRPHYDSFDPQIPGQATALQHGGQRLVSILMYLNDVADGGETVFPQAGVSVSPEAGTGVLFHNCTPDGQIDRASRHAGAPVGAGQKWLATRWIRERVFDTSTAGSGHPRPT